MQTEYADDQMNFCDLDSWDGKMFSVLFPPDAPKARTFASSSKKSHASRAVPFMSLDLTPGAGNLLGESYWELCSPSLGGSSMRNTGESPREEKESTLSQILEEHPPKKYYLTATACKGILRRAEERGKPLPPQLHEPLPLLLFSVLANILQENQFCLDHALFHLMRSQHGRIIRSL